MPGDKGGGKGSAYPREMRVDARSWGDSRKLDVGKFAIHDGIKVIISDSLLGRARNSKGSAMELWRSLIAEWSGAAPQMKQAKARHYQEPARCKTMAALWTQLPAWERLGERSCSPTCPSPSGCAAARWRSFSPRSSSRCSSRGPI